MRSYIIGNDGITLCREAPATVNDGEIAVASNEELHTAPLSGKRLLALWNALPGVEKRRKVGDREVLIDQLWSAIEALPDPEPQSDAKRPSKQGFGEVVTISGPARMRWISLNPESRGCAKVIRDGAKSRFVALFSALMTASSINSENCRQGS